MQPDDLETRAQRAMGRIYLEEEPTIQQWLATLKPTKQGAIGYALALFPCVGWVPRYNLRWFMGDVVAGMTVGLVVVPQALAYALLAKLTPEYGLYTSFIGAMTYWVFGTSRDIVIATTAIGSLLVGSTVTAVEEKQPGVYTAAEVAASLSLISGMILLAIGLLRLGWVVDFIPYTSISAFVTAAAITILSTQFPVALGIRGINTREAPYKVIINTLKNLGHTELDAAIGLTSILLLYLIKTACSQLEVRKPKRRRVWSIISSLRFTFVIVMFTIISYLVNYKLPRDEAKFHLTPLGFRHAGIPRFDSELTILILPKLPAVLIVLVIEHIAIAKSFGRMFGYTVTPSQEILAQGIANLFSPFIGGYVCTGSFSASAVLSKSGVRTPLAGVVSALVLVLALYVATAVFAFIPKAVLAGLIIHATSNLLTSPKALKRYWQLSPFELLIWVVGLVVALFESLDMSIYVTAGLSLGLLLVRMARMPGSFLGRVRIHLVPADDQVVPASHPSEGDAPKAKTAVIIPGEAAIKSYDAYLSTQRDEGFNPRVPLETPYPGMFIYRFPQTLNYTNQGQHVDLISSCITSHTRRTTPEDPSIKPSDRLWNVHEPRPNKDSGSASMLFDGASSSLGTTYDDHLPRLRTIIFDCSAIDSVDITSVQGLVDLRTTLARHAAPGVVEWHFAGVRNRWARRSLAVAGFGHPSNTDGPVSSAQWTPSYAVAGLPADIGEDQGAQSGDEEKSDGTLVESGADEDDVGVTGCQPVVGVNRPFFHVGLAEAVDVAVRSATIRNQQSRGVI
ncbi:Sulfate permease 2 like protein [Verticillium longisporum]|uniref:Sulfate permease 2 like protein n=1 Tax=Verticillium longisporum TaxID=100787 RepID=A0A8I2ZJ26_VERLO|nr:Sulfate permease 2 like protein [Verticillium longisporum]